MFEKTQSAPAPGASNSRQFITNTTKKINIKKSFFCPFIV